MVAKIERWLLFLLILLLPSQLGQHWWPDWSLINGVRVDYLSPTLYLTDILLWGVLICWGSRTLGRRQATSLLSKGLLVGLALITINIWFAHLPWLALYRWIKLGEAALLFAYLTKTTNWQPIVARGLQLSLVWISALAWLQFIGQRSMGGIWYWLGERSFQLTTPGIAKVFIDGVGLILRPYATLPHPNVLAAFLFLGGLIIIYLAKDRGSRLPLVVAAVTVPLTFSRSVIFFEILFLSWLLWRNKFHHQKLIVATVALVALCGVLLIPGNPTSLTERLSMTSFALQTVYQSRWLGVGLGNYLPYLSTQLGMGVYQPVHNILLLVLAELGIVAILILGLGLVKAAQHVGKQKSVLLMWGLVFVIGTGMVDHYWWTLPQTTLLAAILFSLLTLKLPRHE